MNDTPKFDAKQETIITAWYRRGLAWHEQDPYSAFMAYWIAFNAFCYGLYAKEANKPRADIKTRDGIQKLPAGEMEIAGTLTNAAHRVDIRLKPPCSLKLKITERYSEDHIFNQFAEEYQDAYVGWLAKDTELHGPVEALPRAICRQNGCYVMNMARVRDFDPNRSVAEQNGSILAAFGPEDTQDLHALKGLLYLIRCNIFHGEKVPGEPNDDRIVRAAMPVLAGLLRHVLPESVTKESS